MQATQATRSLRMESDETTMGLRHEALCLQPLQRKAAWCTASAMHREHYTFPATLGLLPSALCLKGLNPPSPPGEESHSSSSRSSG